MDNSQRRREQLGVTVRVRRERLGLSQREFALQMGTNQSYLWEIESGRANVTVEILCRIADAFDIRVNELIDF